MSAPSTRVLVVAFDGDAVVDWALQPLRDFRRALSRELRVKIEVERATDFDAGLAAVKRHTADVIMLNTSWREPAQATHDFVRAVRMQRPEARLIYLDTFDQTTSPFFGVLPDVDLYVKKQLLRDRSHYQRDDYRGDYLVSDFFARELGLELGAWKFGSLVPEGQEHKLALGWNLATAKGLRKDALARRSVRSWAERDIDVHCRVGYGAEPSNWYAAHRRQVIVALEGMQTDARIIAAGGEDARVPMDVFQDEMQRTRIAFSPFGWGEVTDRDFHILNAGALLMKPDMSHLETEPSIYRDGETYVAVRWDLADLDEKVDYWLKRPEQAQRIIDTARAEYVAYLRSKRFVHRFGELLELAHQPTRPSARQSS